MNKIFVCVIFSCVYIFVIALTGLSDEMQEERPEEFSQEWFQRIMKGTYRAGSYACSISGDATVLAVGNNLDRIWIFDLNTKRIRSVIHNDVGGFINARIRLSDDGNKMTVRNNLPNIRSDVVRAKLPEEFFMGDFLKRGRSFWIYDTQRGTLIKRLDAVAIPYTDSGHLVLDEAVPPDPTNRDQKYGSHLYLDRGIWLEKPDGTRIGFAATVVGEEASYAPFGFSKDSKELITILGRVSIGLGRGLLAESIDIQSNKLKRTYFYSDYEELRARGEQSFFVMARDISISGDGKYLALIGQFAYVALFDVGTGKVISAKEIDSADDTHFTGCFKLNHSGSIVACQTVSPNTHPMSKKLLNSTIDYRFTDIRGCRVVILDAITTRKKIEILTPDPLIITDVAFSKDDKYIATGTMWGHVFVWTTSNGQLVRRFSLAKDYKDTKDRPTTVIGFCENSDDLIAVYIERYNKSAQVYKHRVSDDHKEKLFVFPP
jgi:WD40 repeat protein